ncbi:hypothetical protein KKF61_02010, partial [Patescibacteria group bacterium]|nr:hypothetical protein [Patescibacteria group bacterium]
EQRFFDTEGTPYFDISLTNSALSGSCSSLLNRGMVLNVYEAGTSALYPENFDYHAITRGSFWDDIWEFGYLYPANFDREALCGDCYLRAYGNAPLAIAPHPNISSGETLVTPQDMITVWDVAGEVKNVCLPSITLPDSLDSEVTYIDHEGNAFEDALLTQKIHESDCSTVIQNSFAPTDLVDVGLSQELAENGTLIFHRAVLGDVSYQFGNYNEVGVSSPVFVDDNVLANNSGHAPLIIAYQNKFSEESIIFPKQVFTFDSDLGVVTACVPALTLENSKKKLIYVSTNGNTYYDPLLQEMTTITSCSTLLSSGAQPKIILSASTTSLPDYGAIAFSRGDIYDARLLGWLRWDDGWVEGDYPADSPILIGTAPLVIALQNHGEESFTWPQQTVIISSDIGDYEVCIPETQVDPGAVLLYLKLDNTIYQDPFFQQPIQCG